MDQAHEALIRKLKEHSKLSRDDISKICSFSYSIRNLAPDEDVIRQGDEPKLALLVVLGNVGRYHLLPEGRRQFLSFHMKGDLPDAQGLFLQKMDHAVCAIGNAVVGSISHKQQRAAAYNENGSFFLRTIFRANAAGLVRDNIIHFPLSLGHLAETLGMAIATVNRSLQELRDSNALDFRNGHLVIIDWIRSTEIGKFSSSYLHLKANSAIR